MIVMMIMNDENDYPADSGKAHVRVLVVFFTG
jgi:hypothetical protein